MAVKLIIVLAVLLGGLALVTQYRAARNEARAEAAYPLEGQMLNVDGTSVHAVVMGEIGR